jgi:hypothetical protein
VTATRGADRDFGCGLCETSEPDTQ